MCFSVSLWWNNNCLRSQKLHHINHRTKVYSSPIRERWRCFFFCQTCINVIKGVANPGPTNFWFDHSFVCNKLSVLGVSYKASELKVLVKSVRTSYACNSQDMWKWKSARPTTNRKTGYTPGLEIYVHFFKNQPATVIRKETWHAARSFHVDTFGELF